jgi:hypothetical protein
MIINKTKILCFVIIFMFIAINFLSYSNRDTINIPIAQFIKLDNNIRIIEPQSIMLINKSNGLQNPTKEAGKTEYEMADINNDGYVDIISVGDHGSPYVNSNQHGIMVWLGDGDGNWSVHQNGNFGYGGCAIGDINLDGNLDVAWGIHHDWGNEGFGDTLIGAALGDGSGVNWTGWSNGLGTNGETYGMFSTDLADFNCDGKLDIVSESFGCCNGLHVYKNHGNGSWSPKWSLTGGNVQYTIESCDINADGYPDFASTKHGSIIFFGDGNFNFSQHDTGLPSSDINCIDCGDMNNDGSDDLVLGYGSNGVRCYIYNQNGDNWISYSTGLPTSGTYPLTQFGDLNGDGFLDIVAYQGPTGYVYLGNGNGDWVSDATFSMPPNGDYSAMRVDGDIDHDGREDIVIQAEEGDWLNSENILRCYSPWLQPTSLSALIQKPNGGEVYRIGSIREICWLSATPSSYGIGTVSIQLSVNGASGPWTTIASNLSNNGRYQWLVNGQASNNSRIKVIVTTNQGNISVISSANFSLVGESSNISPNIPIKPSGPSEGQPFVNYTFSTVTTDPNNDNIRYGWDWNGDLLVDEWTLYYPSNTPFQINHSWSIEDVYDIRVKAQDIDGDTSNFSTPLSIIIGTNNSIIPLIIGWNMITIPFRNNWSASDLADNITGCSSISRWDATNQTYKTYIVEGPPTFDFPIIDGYGYFINMISSDTLVITDDPIDSVNISLKVGWNLIGWYKNHNTTASSLASNITGCTSVSKWNASMQTYNTYIVGGPPTFDFTIKRGMGIFVDVIQESFWYGDG